MLVFQSVTKSFPNGQSALTNINFEIPKSDFAFITGPSGAGKTTLMRLITKATEPTTGQITFNNQALNNLKNNQLWQHRRQVGVVFQDYKLLPELNAWENIALSLEILGQKQAEIDKRVSDLLKLVELSAKAELFPSQLSGGEAQRVSIARALASAPFIIFADEPTGNLDPQSSLHIVNLLKKINELGTTILMATHDQTLLDSFKNERRLHLEKGKLVSDTGKKTKPKKANQLPEDKIDQVSETEIKQSIEKVTKVVKENEASKEIKASQQKQETKETKKSPRLKLPSFNLFSKKKKSLITKVTKKVTDDSNDSSDS